MCLVRLIVSAFRVDRENETEIEYNSIRRRQYNIIYRFDILYTYNIL